MRNGKKTPSRTPLVSITVEEYQQLLRYRQERTALLEKQLALAAEKAELVAENESLRWALLNLQRLHWGRSSEKRQLPEDPSQLRICFDSPCGTDPVEETRQGEKLKEKSGERYSRFRKNFLKKQTPHARGPIPANLPREEERIPMPGGINLEGARKIGEEITEQYAVRPAYVYVRRIIREKYLLADGRIVIAPLPVMAHPRSNASESVLAHIAVAKYADHLPINRQLEIFERSGIRFAPSTVSNWMQAAARRIEPIYNELREQVKYSDYVMADETPHPVLETQKKGTLHKGYMWAFYLPEQKMPYFEYHTSRSSQGIGTLLEGNVRVVQSDGFSVYNRFDKLPGKLHLACWAHVRRKFIEAAASDPPRSTYVLDEIARLYRIEKQIKEQELKGQAVVKLRQEQAYPIIKRLEEWIKQNYIQLTQGSPMEKAVTYLYTRLEQLSGYTNEAKLQIDNNPVERSIRPLTLNRKNTLFSGSHEAAHTAAIFFSLLGCCKENGVNPTEWLQEVLIRVQEYQHKNDYTELLPVNWKRK